MKFCKLFYFLIFIPIIASKNLIFSSVYFRHGDRNPERSIPGDDNKWKEGLGELTLTGIQQEVELGEFLRKRYDGFINTEYAVKEIQFRSTDYNRVLMSGISVLAGFYPSTPRQKDITGLTFQPIPLHTLPTNEDYFLTNRYSNCSNFVKLDRETKTSHNYISYVDGWRQDMDYCSSQTNIKINFKEFCRYADVLFIEKLKGRDWPSWVNGTLYENMMNALRVESYLSFGMPGYIPYYGGVYLKEVLSNMKSTINHKIDKKAFFYSVHDINIASLLMALKVYYNSSIPYSSCVMIELYNNTEKNEGHHVEIHFRNGTGTSSKQLIIPNCTPSCPLDKFQSLIQDNLPGDEHQMCGDELSHRFVICLILLVFTSLALIISNIVWCWYSKFYKKCINI